MKKVLIVASVASMIGQFNMCNIEILQRADYYVSVACNFKDRTVWDDDKVDELKKKLKEEGVPFYQIDFTRSAFEVLEHFKAYRQLEKLVKKENYEMIHCHTPIAAMITRVVAHWNGIKVIYTAHGFHFFKGAPLKNWVLYYPVEKFLSRWTDCLITINKEDYRRAKKKFHAKRTEYVPGIGIDLEKIEAVRANREEKRKEIGVPKDAYMLLSVGELSIRKNHKLVLHALCGLRKENLYYVVCGQGQLKEELKRYVKEHNLAEKVRFLGYRTDVLELCKAADLFVFPSLQEGLPVALMEAMACGVPCLASDIRGNRDLFEGKTAKCLLPLDRVKSWNESISNWMTEDRGREKNIERNKKAIRKFSSLVVKEKLNEIYTES